MFFDKCNCMEKKKKKEEKEKERKEKRKEEEKRKKKSCDTSSVSGILGSTKQSAGSVTQHAELHGVHLIYLLWCLKSFKSRHTLRKEDKSNTPLVIFVLQKCIQLQFYSGLLPGWVKPPHITHPQSDWSLSGASCGNEPFEIKIYNKPFCSGKVSSFPCILSSLCSLQLIWLPTLLKITSHTYFKDLGHICVL